MHQERFATGGKAVRNLLLAICGILSFSGATMRAQQRIDPYPLAMGNYWVYKGHVEQTALYLANGQMLPPRMIEKTWRSEITKITFRKDGTGAKAPVSPSIVAAGFANFPLCLPLFDQDRGQCILVVVNSRRFYRIFNYPESILEYLRSVQDANHDLGLRDEVPILDLPLSPGKRWGVPFSTWSVTQREKNSLVGVRGIGADSNPEGFVLESSDNTGTVRFTFVPGIGITHVFSESLFPRGDSNHWELEARLVEVHLNQTNSAPPH